MSCYAILPSPYFSAALAPRSFKSSEATSFLLSASTSLLRKVSQIKHSNYFEGKWEEGERPGRKEFQSYSYQP